VTCKERFEKEYPYRVFDASSMETGCPHAYGYLEELDDCIEIRCEDCWTREIPEEKPSVRDTVEVVRCKDCIHYEMGVCLKIYSDGAVSECAWQERKPDDFCSYGERKEENATG
jgi:hypothetical protein